MGLNGKPGGQSDNFPQTGFAGAKYKIIVSGTKSVANYSFSVTSLSVPGAITVDSDGFVMLHKNPKGAAKIGITKGTFNLTHSIWMSTWVVLQNKTGNFSTAKSTCSSYATSTHPGTPDMGEIAFTPYAFDYALPSKTVANYVIRDANG